MKKYLLLLALFIAMPVHAQVLTNMRTAASLSVACTNTATSCSGTANSALDVPSTNYNVATVTVSGTYTGATVAFDFSDDGGNTYFQDLCARTDSNTTEISEALPTNQTRSWDCGIYGTSRFRIRLSAVSTGAVNAAITLSSAPIEPVATTSLANTVGSTDPCQNSSVLKSSASISVASATTTQLVAPSGSTAVYVCGGSFTIAPSATAADTAQFNTGTGATCTGSTVTKTGTFGNGDLTAAAPVVPVTLSSNGTVFSAAAGSGVCMITTGTAVSVQGVLSFVQQ